MQKEIRPTRLNRLLSGDFEFNISDYFSRGFELLQQNIGGFIGFTLLLGAARFVASLIESSVLGGNVNILTYLISALWMPGYYIVASKIFHRKDYSFNNFFDGHKQGGRLLGVFFLMMLIGLIPVIPVVTSLFINDSIIQEFQLMIESAEYGELYWPQIGTVSIILGIAAFIGMVYLQVSYFFAIPLVTFTNLNPWQAMEMSRKVAAKKFIPILGIYFLIFLLNIGGFIAILIGLLFTVPASMCITYLAFEDVFQLETEDEDEITDYTEHIIE